MYRGKKNFNPYLIPDTKINLRCIADIVKVKTIKLLK